MVFLDPFNLTWWKPITLGFLSPAVILYLASSVKSISSYPRLLKNCNYWHTGIPGLWRQELEAGRWTLDSGRWTLDTGLWTLEFEPWTLGSERWTLNTGPLDAKLWKLDSRRWTLNPGPCTLDSERWMLDCGH